MNDETGHDVSEREVTAAGLPVTNTVAGLLLEAALNAAGIDARTNTPDFVLSGLIADTEQGRRLLELADLGEQLGVEVRERGYSTRNPCPAQPASGDLSCIYPTGHDGSHRNFQGIEWPSEPEPVEALAERYVPRHFDVATRCEVLDCDRPHDPGCGVINPDYVVPCNERGGHAGDHKHEWHENGVSWPNQAETDPTEPLELVEDSRADAWAGVKPGDDLRTPSVADLTAELDRVREQRDELRADTRRLASLLTDAEAERDAYRGALAAEVRRADR